MGSSITWIPAFAGMTTFDDSVRFQQLLVEYFLR